MIVRPLTEYCTLNMGQSPDSKTYNTQGKGLPFYQGNADFGESHPITRVWCSAPVKVAEDGDILISVRAPIGAMNMAVERCCIGRGLAALTPIRNKCSKKFLYYALQSKVDSLIAQGTGSTFKAIGKKVLETTCIPAYSTIEQEQIAETIGHIDNTIAARRNQLALLDQLVKSRFIELFGDCDLTHPQESWVTIKEIGSVVGGATPKTDHDEYWGGSYRWITPAELDADSGYIYDSVRKLTKAGVESCSLQEMPVGTVILSSRAPIGKVAIAGNTFYCNQGFKNIICKEGITPRYLYTVLLLNVEYLNSLGRGATFKEISKGIVESIRIPVPSMELQEQFAAFVEQTDKSKYYSSLSFRYCQAAANTYRQEWMTCRTSDF